MLRFCSLFSLVPMVCCSMSSCQKVGQLIRNTTRKLNSVVCHKHYGSIVQKQIVEKLVMDSECLFVIFLVQNKTVIWTQPPHSADLTFCGCDFFLSPKGKIAYSYMSSHGTYLIEQARKDIGVCHLMVSVEVADSKNKRNFKTLSSRMLRTLEE